MLKRVTVGLMIIFSLSMNSCSPVPAMSTPATPAPTQTEVVVSSSGSAIQPYSDLRDKNYLNLEVELSKKFLQTLTFNKRTQWPEETKMVAMEVMELGKNPGLGVRQLHEQGITGKGVTVAIIDQNLLLNHPEFAGKIIKYKDVSIKPSKEGSMHAPAVTSLLIGNTIGTAPDTLIYFAAAPAWNKDAQSQADALNWIIDENDMLPEGQKIRAVSISAAPSGPGSPFEKNNAAWDAAYERANKAGILVLDCSSNRGITLPCYLDLSDPDSVAKCTPGYLGMETTEISYKSHWLYVPTSQRTVAEEYVENNPSYQYTGRGGLSWSIPYLTGVLAMGWQLQPQLTGDELLKLIDETGYKLSNGGKIIDPPKFIEAVKKIKKQIGKSYASIPLS